MAQFIQANQLNPIQGSAGQQSVVQDQSPTLGEGISGAVQNIGGIVDTAGQIYGENKGKSLVNEEIENIDSAISEAESGRFGPGDDVPDSLKLDQQQWDMLSSAVRSGTMSQDRARLIAASRLRSRISEEPFFADRMRKAASGVLGFNIESEAAQQYFASFPTRGQLAEGDVQNKKIQEMQQFAEEESRLTGIPADKIYRQMWSLETAERNKEIATLRREQNLITDTEMFTEFNTNNAKTAFTGVLGDLKSVYDEEGSVKPEVYNKAFADAQQQEMQELAQIWKGDQSDPAYARAQSVIQERYDGYRTLLEAVDYDKLNQITIDRNSNERTIFTDKTFADVKMINEVAGQEGVKAYFDSMSGDMNETQRRQLFERFPILKRLHSLANSSSEELSGRLKETSRKVLTDEPLNESDEEVLDPVVTDIHKNGSDEVKTRVFDKLVRDGKKYKMASIVVNGPPGATSTDNIANVKRMYDEELPDMVTTLARQVEQFGSEVNRFGEPAVSMEIDNKGNIVVNSLRPMSMPEGKLSELRNTASKINQFNKAHRNNWSLELGESADEYRVRVDRLVDEGRGQASAVIKATAQDNFAKFTNAGAEDKARQAYEAMREENPEAFTTPFETIYEEIRRRRVEKVESDRTGGRSSGSGVTGDF